MLVDTERLLMRSDLPEERLDDESEPRGIAPTPAPARRPSATASLRPKPSPQPGTHMNQPADVHQPSGLPTPVITGKRPSAMALTPNQSALEALRARRSGQTATNTPAAKQVAVPTERGTVISKAASVRKPKATVTTSKATGTIAESQTPHNAARTSLKEKSAPIARAQSAKEVYDFEADDDNITVGGKRVKKHATWKDDVTSPPKQPERIQPRRDAKPDAIYELAESDDDNETEEDFRPVKTKRPSKTAAVKSVAKPDSKRKRAAATSSLPGSTPANLQRVQKQAGKATSGKAQDQMKSASKTNTAKNRMKPLNPDVNSGNIDTRPTASSRKPPPPHAATRLGEGAASMQDVETLEDFENKTMQYDEDDQVFQGSEVSTKAKDAEIHKTATLRPSTIGRKDDTSRRAG